MTESSLNKQPLTDDELVKATGGADNKKTKPVIAYCNTCKKKTEFKVFSGTRGKCKVCGTPRDDL